MLYDDEKWQSLITAGKLPNGTEGFYLPRTNVAYLASMSPFLVLNLYHEFHGHGLFFEKSLLGREMAEKDRKLAEMEKEIIGLDSLSDGILKLDNKHPLFPKYLEVRRNLEGINSHSYKVVEGFAVWMEHFLSKKFNKEGLFFEKQREMKKRFKEKYKISEEGFRKFMKFENDMGKHWLMYQLGFPKKYTDEILVELLERYYKNRFGNIVFALLYDEKPDSDIDLFVVSNDRSHSYYNGWLDIFHLQIDEFIKRTGLFDIGVTDPLFTGRVVFGDSAIVEGFKRKVLDAEITQDAINYNIKRARERKEIAKKYGHRTREHENTSVCSHTYLMNAKELKKGKKLLIQADLRQKYGF